MTTYEIRPPSGEGDQDRLKRMLDALDRAAKALHEADLLYARIDEPSQWLDDLYDDAMIAEAKLSKWARIRHIARMALLREKRAREEVRREEEKQAVADAREA